LIISNRIKCKLCGDVIESTFTHDYRRCSCGAVAVDGGREYLRRSGNVEDFEEMSEIYRQPIEDILRSVAGSMALSGMELSEEDEERIRLFADEPEYVEKIVKELVEKHRQGGSG